MHIILWWYEEWVYKYLIILCSLNCLWRRSIRAFTDCRPHHWGACFPYPIPYQPPASHPWESPAPPLPGGASESGPVQLGAAQLVEYTRPRSSADAGFNCARRQPHRDLHLLWPRVHLLSVKGWVRPKPAGPAASSPTFIPSTAHHAAHPAHDWRGPAWREGGGSWWGRPVAWRRNPCWPAEHTFESPWWKSARGGLELQEEQK